MSLGRTLAAVAACTLLGCTSIDPGPNFVIPDDTLNADYFFCHVEPELIVAKKCGDSTPGSCHYNSSAVSGMALIQHPATDCGGGDHPLNPSDVGVGSPARANFSAASLVMTRDYQTAPMYVRPLCRTDGDCTQGHSHPIGIFNTTDPVVDVLKAWAQKP